MKKEVYPALQMVLGLTNKYPKCWDIIEDMRVHFASEFPSWCYIPIGACQAITDRISGHVEIDDSTRMAAAAPWRQSKNVYTFDLDLQNTLFEQADEELVLPVSIFERMPYPCLYIETKELPIHGFFVHREYDGNTKKSELRFYFVYPDGHGYGMPMHILQNKTIAECMEETYRIARENIPAMGNWDMQPLTTQIALALQLVIYICAENAEVSENPVQKQIYRRDRTVKDAYREMRRWDVGYKMGSLLRAAKTAGTTGERKAETAGTGSPKRPHSRRGHWSHYHVGPGRKETIVKWIAPTFINAEKLDLENMPVTITKITK